MIAVCGATGAGKSSLLNALLDGIYISSHSINCLLIAYCIQQTISFLPVACEVRKRFFVGSVPNLFRAACTAVITEISYQPQKSIAADVSFLNYEDWKAELVVLLEDMIDEDGSLKRSTDLRSDAGIAWHKVSSPANAMRRVDTDR
jgi:energy-coupling factor transporter ATP-binding protein EcfA2